MGKTKAGKGKIVARIFLVIGILLSMTAGSGLAVDLLDQHQHLH